MYPVHELPLRESGTAHPDFDDIDRCCDWIGVQLVVTDGRRWAFKSKAIRLREIAHWDAATAEWSCGRRTGRHNDPWEVMELAARENLMLIREIEP